jgi:hypothetical protein
LIQCSAKPRPRVTLYYIASSVATSVHSSRSSVYYCLVSGTTDCIDTPFEDTVFFKSTLFYRKTRSFKATIASLHQELFLDRSVCDRQQQVKVASRHQELPLNHSTWKNQ